MKKNICLLSDQVIHWNIVPTSRGKNVFPEAWGNESTLKMLGFIQLFFNNEGLPLDFDVSKINSDIDQLDKANPAQNDINHVFATWNQYKEGKDKVWRVQEMVHVGHAEKAIFDKSAPLSIQGADLVLIQDWGMDIHDFQIQNLADLIKEKWVIYRLYSPVFDGNLWHEYQRTNGHRKILLLRVNDLRKLNTSISRGLSWEQTIQDIINEIYFKRNISLYPLRNSEYVLISFGATGTLLIHNPFNEQQKEPTIKLFFDSMGIEGYWEQSHPGYLPGDLELLAALISKEVLFPGLADELKLERAVRAHLLARRAMILCGASNNEGSLVLRNIEPELKKVYSSQSTHEFMPVELEFNLFQSIFRNQKNKTSTSEKDWSLLGQTKWDLYSLARQIAISGPMKALQGWNIPIAKYNYLLTVDRKEIEFLHHLKTLITEYLQSKNNQPLSIAVFGSPGSGKSFSIKQLAKALDIPDQEIKDITFNLSQFNEDNPVDLYQAFHAVRDISLSGKTPLVFWDEFDSKQLSWLRYFLAPMQDGEFQEGQLTHNIGKSIFVFAGGTCSSMEEFEVKAHTAIAEKGPDFLSRIKGFINVMGPNPVLPFDAIRPDELMSIDEIDRMNMAKNVDPEFIIRRAILINSLLQIGFRQLFSNGELQIDDGVLNALLQVPKFKHGTRSMETIFKTSQLFGKVKYHRSDLPPESQMNLHVDGQQFYQLIAQQPKYYDGGEAFYYLVNEITFDEDVVAKMAIGIHVIYSLVFTRGEDQDPLSITKEEFLDDLKKIQNLPEEMPHDEVSQNYHNARKIPEKLTAIGYTIVPLDAKLKADELTRDEIEKVSRLEHIRWVRHHIDAGWTYAPQKNKTNKQHDALVAWDEIERQHIADVYGKCYVQKMGVGDGAVLTEHYRNLDRVISLAIPWILENVGFKIVKLARTEEDMC